MAVAAAVAADTGWRNGKGCSMLIGGEGNASNSNGVVTGFVKLGE
jgi:hypothetical protein